MPYLDPEKQKAARREWFRRRYADPEFQAREAIRKAKWLEQPTAKRKNRASTRRFRQKESTKN